MVCEAGKPSTRGWRGEECKAAAAKMLGARCKWPGRPLGVQGLSCTWGFCCIIRLT